MKEVQIRLRHLPKPVETFNRSSGVALSGTDDGRARNEDIMKQKSKKQMVLEITATRFNVSCKKAEEIICGNRSDLRAYFRVLMTNRTDRVQEMYETHSGLIQKHLERQV